MPSPGTPLITRMRKIPDGPWNQGSLKASVDPQMPFQLEVILQGRSNI